jgi:hypothetical protein
MIWVDDARKYRTRRGFWSHLWTTKGNEDALHDMAQRIGLKPEWFQDRDGFPHYDLTGRMIAKAVAAGAVRSSLRSWIEGGRA